MKCFVFQIDAKRPKYVFDALPLERLSADENDINTLYSFMFMTLHRLCYLSLANNQMTVIQPWSFEGLCKLESLNLESNNIAAIDMHGIFAKCSINLRGNNIKGFQDFQGLPVSLEKIFTYCLAIQGNHIIQEFCLFVCLLVCLFFCWFVRLFVCLFVCLYDFI